jgi:hypothetical protein
MNITNQYYKDRKHYNYYEKISDILSKLKFTSIIDIGSRKSPVFKKIDNNVYKSSLDLLEINNDNKNINHIIADFYKWVPDKKYDIVLCLQVLEHLDKPAKFAQKLFNTGNKIIISLPYKWKKGVCIYHKQDPVDEKLIKQWTNRDPLESYIVEDNGLKRIICIY